MTPLFRRTLLYLGLYLLSPLVLRAQWIDLTVDVSVTSFSFRSPSVSSYARAVLYGPTGARDYSLVILGHEVYDDSVFPLIYSGRFASDLGIANNYVTLAANPGACYTARAAGHSNKYGIHEFAEIFWPQCAPEPPDPVEKPPKENCPILLDLKRDGYHLSGTDPAVTFDIDGDGSPDSIAWTQAGGDDAFLCLDRNHNGTIDDGRELFGYATPLLSGKQAKIGYRALAELDDPELGGNRDGKIDAQDLWFSELCAWIDQNRDGISEIGEIYTLGQVNVAALDYDYKNRHITDSFGNVFRYSSRVDMYSASGNTVSWPSFDVIFAEP